MTGFRQRQNRSILTAPGARGLSPHSLVQPDSRLALPSGHGNNYSVKKQKGYGCVLKQKNITITIPKQHSDEGQ
jgi:hypothetical protein